MTAKRIKDISVALKIYFENFEIGNAEIEQIFGSMSSATMSKLKKMAREKMVEEEMLQYSAHSVNTKIAYKVWGIDIEDLKKRRKELMKLGLC